MRQVGRKQSPGQVAFGARHQTYFTFPEPEPAAKYPIGSRQTQSSSAVLLQKHLRPIQKLRAGNARPGPEIISPRYGMKISADQIALRGNNNPTLPPYSLCVTPGQSLWCNHFSRYHIFCISTERQTERVTVSELTSEAKQHVNKYWSEHCQPRTALFSIALLGFSPGK